MFERLTDRARKVMALANQEAQRFNHEYIGTEHILLGLVKEGSGVGANVLKNLDIDLRKVRLGGFREELERPVERARAEPTRSPYRSSPGAERGSNRTAASQPGVERNAPPPSINSPSQSGWAATSARPVSASRTNSARLSASASAARCETTTACRARIRGSPLRGSMICP